MYFCTPSIRLTRLGSASSTSTHTVRDSPMFSVSGCLIGAVDA